ncbi:MAG: hypothetical protein EXS27_04580 [Pedosphaera sp.]|nr:hypothetical protein [Pedosphaera sp.]
MSDETQSFLTKPRKSALANPLAKAWLMSLAPLAIILLAAFTAPGKMRELDLTSEQQTIAWLLLAALLLSLMAWMALIFAAARLMERRAVIASHFLSGTVFVGGAWALTRPNFNPTQLISAMMLLVAVSTLINIFGLALVLWQNLQQKLANAESQAPKSDT